MDYAHYRALNQNASPTLVLLWNFFKLLEVQWWIYSCLV